MSLFLQALIGAIVWTFANLLYVDLKRKGVHNLARIVAFWVGMPTTWLSLILVREVKQPRFGQVEDDDRALLAEVRRDRARRLTTERERSTPRDDPPDRAQESAGPPGRDEPEPDTT